MNISELIKELKEWKKELGDVEVTLGQYSASEDVEWQAHISMLDQGEVQGKVVLSIL